MNKSAYYNGRSVISHALSLKENFLEFRNILDKSKQTEEDYEIVKIFLKTHLINIDNLMYAYTQKMSNSLNDEEYQVEENHISCNCNDRHLENLEKMYLKQIAKLREEIDKLNDENTKLKNDQNNNNMKIVNYYKENISYFKKHMIDLELSDYFNPLSQTAITIDDANKKLRKILKQIKNKNIYLESEFEKMKKQNEQETEENILYRKQIEIIEESHHIMYGLLEKKTSAEINESKQEIEKLKKMLKEQNCNFIS